MQDRLEPPSVENLTEARRAVEAMLLVANDPTPVQLLAQLVELPVDLVQAMCLELAGEYEEQRRGFQLAEVAGGWRFQTHPDTHAYVERFALEGMPNRLSSAALETLAIVAYKQPISRAQIGAIRGVNVDGVLRTLVQRGYVDEQGRDDGPGQATLFGTTSFFLEQLGLMSLDDLPPLGDFVPSVEVLEALENTLRVDPEPEIVIVDDDGESITAESAPEETPSTNGHGPESHNGATAEPTAETDADAEAPAEEIDGQADAEGQADAGDTDGTDDAVEEIDPAAEVADEEDGAEPDQPAAESEAVADDEVGIDLDLIDEAIDDDDDGEPAPEQGDVADSTNGSGPESSNGSMVATDGHADDEPVFEVLSDPAASVIALDTHLASSIADTVDETEFDNSEVDDPADELEVEVDAQPESEFEFEFDAEVADGAADEIEVVSEPEVVDEDDLLADEDDDQPVDETPDDIDDGGSEPIEEPAEPVEEPADAEAVEGLEQPIDEDPVEELEAAAATSPADEVAESDDQAPAPDVADEMTEAVAVVPPAATIERAEPESTVADELEVAADPEVEMTDGTIATGAAGVDDARFPGARSSSPPDVADRLDQGEEPGQGMGLDQTDPSTWDSSTLPPSTGPNVTN